MSLKEAFGKAGVYPTVNPGEVWKVKDSVIGLIDKLTRHWHEERYCVILSNKAMCSDSDWPLVLIAPLTSQVYPKPRPDLVIDTTNKNGLQVKSRLILSQIQAIRKTDLQERVGEVNVTKWGQIMKYVLWHIDRR